MEEMPLQNLHDREDSAQPMILSKNLSKKRWTTLVLMLVVIIIVGTGYFLVGKTLKSLVFQAENFLTTKTTETANINIFSGREYYRVSNNVAYFQDREIVGADASTFQELGDRWAKDKNTVYWEGQKQKYLDSKTVKVFPYVYVLDKVAVWVYDTGSYMSVDKTDADPGTFSVISHGYGKDKNNIYYFAQKIENADVQSFTLLRATNDPSSEGLESSWYAKDKNNIYYRAAVIQGADVQSFSFLGNEYAKDKSKVYYQGRVLANADINSFALAGGYAKDKNHVFSADTILDIDIDPASFAVVGGGAIKDSKRVYFLDYYEDKYNLVASVDAPTFQHIGVCKSVEKSSGSYFKDKNYVFVERNPVVFIDSASFQYFGDYGVAEGMPYSVSYAKDKNTIYHSCGEILAGADKLTFVDLKDGYAKDKSKVWYLADVIDGADTATFQSLGEGYAQDKSHVYFAGVVTEKVDIVTKNDWGISFAKPSDWSITSNNNEQIHLEKISGEWTGDKIDIRYISNAKITTIDAKFGSVTYYYDESSQRWMKIGQNEKTGDMEAPVLATVYTEYPYTADNFPVFVGTNRWLTLIVPLSHKTFLKLHITGSGQTQPLKDLVRTIKKI